MERGVSLEGKLEATKDGGKETERQRERTVRGSKIALLPVAKETFIWRDS